MSRDNSLMDAIFELYNEYCRLKGHLVARTQFEQWFDIQSGIENKYMEEFVVWLHEEVLSRLSL